MLALLRPLWARVPETASRLRQRIEAVLAAAAALGHRDRKSDQSGRLAWPPRGAPGAASAVAAGRSLSRAAVAGRAGFLRGLVRPAERVGARDPLRDADRATFRRSAPPRVARDRSRTTRVDLPRRAHEGEAAAPGAAHRRDAGDPRRSRAARGRAGQLHFCLTVRLPALRYGSVNACARHVFRRAREKRSGTLT